MTTARRLLDSVASCIELCKQQLTRNESVKNRLGRHVRLMRSSKVNSTTEPLGLPHWRRALYLRDLRRLTGLIVHLAIRRAHAELHEHAEILLGKEGHSHSSCRSHYRGQPLKHALLLEVIARIVNYL